MFDYENATHGDGLSAELKVNVTSKSVVVNNKIKYFHGLIINCKASNLDLFPVNYPADFAASVVYDPFPVKQLTPKSAQFFKKRVCVSFVE
jgi:hypothetical protein